MPPRTRRGRQQSTVSTTANSDLTTLTGATLRPRRDARTVPSPLPRAFASPAHVVLTPHPSEGAPIGPHPVPNQNPVFLETSPIDSRIGQIDPSTAAAPARPAGRRRANAAEAAGPTVLIGADAEEGVPPEDFDTTLAGTLSPNGERMDVSMTIGRKGCDIYQFWFARLFLFLTFIAVKAAVGEEVGPKGGHSHLQIFFSCLVNVAFEDALKVINKAIKEFIPIPRGDKGYISSKVLQGTQCALGMIGYISKLPMRVRLWNIDAAELAEGQKYYSLVRVDPLKGKRPLNKSNFFKEVFAFWHRELRPTFYNIEIVVMYMVQSGEYLPTAVWVAGGAGTGVDFTRSSQYWGMLHTPSSVTMEDVLAIFFYNPYNNKRQRYFNNSVPDITEQQNAEARENAAKERERKRNTPTLHEARATADASRPSTFEHHFSHAGAVHIDNTEVHIVDSDSDCEAVAQPAEPQPAETTFVVDADARRGSMFNSMADLIAGMRSNQAAQPLSSEDLAGAGHHHNQLDHDSGEDDFQLGSSRTRRRISSEYVEDEVDGDD